MRDVMRQVRSVCVAFVIALFCTPAFSIDPLTLLLLRVLRDKVISAGIENAVERAPSPQATPPLAPALPGVPYAGFDDAQLRQLIDEGFVYLTSAQRDQVYSSLRRIMADPKNAAEIPALIADLAIKASAVRQAHEQLSMLSSAQKRRIVSEAREEYEKMPIETREQMASVLRQRLVPLPVDLTDMILAEFDRVRALTVLPPVAATTPSAASSTAPVAASPADAN
jgi:hypothetical protein